MAEAAAHYWEASDGVRLAWRELGEGRPVVLGTEAGGGGTAPVLGSGAGGGSGTGSAATIVATTRCPAVTTAISAAWRLPVM